MWPDSPSAPSSWVPLSGPASRPLRPDEIERLLALGCEAADWSLISVSEGFSPEDCMRVRFSGVNHIGATGGHVRLSGGIFGRAGLRDAHLAGCRIGDHARIERVGLLASVWTGDEVTILDCARVAHRDGSTFGNDVEVGVHHAGADRRVPVYAELPFDTLAAAASPWSAEQSEALRTQARDYLNAGPRDVSVLADGARIEATPMVEGFWIGPGGIVRGAGQVQDVTLLCSPEQSCRIETGAVVRRTIMQWGAAIDDQAFAQDAFLAEEASISRHAMVMRSALGPNSHVAEGEISASIIGPFCGFHHQALLVAACWPEGRGNVGHGANVGSNHTGRAPDQEIRCGEGTFFGLGVNIKMPSDFSEAPYLLIATGTDTLPQRIAMPFSLVLPPTDSSAPIPAAFNEIRPAWGLRHNSYGILRNAWKFGRRNRAAHSHVRTDIFTPTTVRGIQRAHGKLDQLSGKSWYTGRELSGLGKNAMSETARLEALETYAFFLRWYGLRAAFRKSQSHEPSRAENDEEWQLGRELLGEDRLRLPASTLTALYLESEERLLTSVLACKTKDDTRGPRIIADYAAVHAPAAEDPFVLAMRERLQGFRSAAG